MSRIGGRMIVFAVVLIAASASWRTSRAETQDGRMAPWRVERDVRRFRAVATDRVLELLAIRPGMTILDIGAGTGQFAYEFARRLDGTGTVYATDTKDFCVDYMREEALRRGLKNFRPVRVRPDGVDDFYRRQKYDLVTVFHVYIPYEDRVEYFRELRGFLADDGRLVLVLYKTPAAFAARDFAGDLRGLIGELSREPADSPFIRGMREKTRTMLRENREAEPSRELKEALAADWNAMISDPHFWKSFADGAGFRNAVRLSPEEQALADWILLPYRDPSFGDRNATAPGARRTGGSGPADSTTVNKLLVIQRFRKFLATDGMFTSGFTDSVKSAFEKAGYRLRQQYPDVIPFEDVIVFSAR